MKNDKQKRELERTILALEGNLEKYIQEFDTLIRSAVDSLSKSLLPIDARPYLIRSKQILEEIARILEQIKELETRLAKLTKHEQRLLAKEVKVA